MALATQSETRATLEHLLCNETLSLVELYELKLDDIMHQPVDYAVLAKKCLRILLDSTGSGSVNDLMSVLSTELTDIKTTRRLERNLTRAEISESICLSCKGFI
ncbi:hypothetical protein N7520_005311 [Penicillium odoratum]|uniref:uncharacterized protein n=1 Tax=Penicillium odoratum TaxID=1167516 RepID=UPI00254813B8|nr:uncharacterized protein N7520_005311 [Penicillium odoratum]KAJ5765752.1 hypothetical protein N7520_005311 [Penicillium odoratum]